MVSTLARLGNDETSAAALYVSFLERLAALFAGAATKDCDHRRGQQKKRKRCEGDIADASR